MMVLAIVTEIGASLILLAALRARLRPGFGRSWRLQMGLVAIGIYLVAINGYSLSAGHLFSLSLAQTMQVVGVLALLALACSGAAVTIGLLRILRASPYGYEHVLRWTRWVFDQRDT